jgi:uncharacterized protein (DUF2141 family)
MIWPQSATISGFKLRCGTSAIAAMVEMVMKKVLVALLVGLAGLPGAPATAAPGGDAAACARGESAVLVRVSGFKATSGNLRVQIYGANPADFLAKGKKLRRIDLPVRSSRMDVCVALPGPGNYAVAVRHDVDGDGARGDWGDGGGFSRNPSLSLISLKPKYRDVVIQVGRGVRPVDVVLNYRKGLSIGPVTAL